MVGSYSFQKTKQDESSAECMHTEESPDRRRHCCRIARSIPFQSSLWSMNESMVARLEIERLEPEPEPALVVHAKKRFLRST